MQTIETATTEAATIATAKPAKRAARAKPEAVAKPSKPAATAKPATAKPDATAKLEATRAARAVANAAVSTYYSGLSLPFKAAADRFADLRLDKPAKRATERQAALLAVMLAADTAGNIKRNGQFTRGGFKLPASLFDKSAPAGSVVDCQPETGCLSDMLGRAVHYVSGPTSGNGQRDTVLRLDFKAARADITAQLGGALAREALAVLDKLTGAKAA